MKNKKQTIILAATSLVLMVAAYGMVSNQYIFNHDSINRIYTTETFGTYLASGRPLRDILEVFPAFGTMYPQLMFIYLYITFVVNALLIYKLFDIQSLTEKLLILVVTISSPILAIYWAYGNDIWMYSLGLCIATLSVIYCVKQKPLGIIICTVLFLSDYQAILSYAVTLYVVYEMREAIRGAANASRIMKSFGWMICGAILYFVLLKAILLIFSVSLVGYMNADQIGVKTIIINIPRNIYYSYIEFLRLITGQHLYINATLVNRLLSPLILIIMLIPYFNPKLKSNKRNAYIYSILFLLFPLFANAALFATNVSFMRSDFALTSILIMTVVFVAEFQLSLAYNRILIAIILIFSINNIVTINNMNNYIMKKNNLDIELATAIYIDLISETSYKQADSLHFCGNITTNENVEFNLEMLPYLGSSFIYSPYPSYFWENAYAESEKELAAQKYEAMYKFIGINVNVIYDKCEPHSISYPQDGYIVERENDVFDIYLSVVSEGE